MNNKFATTLVAVLFCLVSVPAQSAIVNFTSFLSGANEVPPNTSTATGGAGIIYQFDTVSNMLSWTIGFEGLTDPATAAHFHIGAPGVNGPPEIDLPTGDNLVDPLLSGASFVSGIGQTSGTFQGNAGLTTDQQTALFGGNMYVNIHTASFPGGEIRGQVVQVIPVPAAVWLLGSGLLAMVGWARRNKTS